MAVSDAPREGSDEEAVKRAKADNTEIKDDEENSTKRGER